MRPKFLDKNEKDLTGYHVAAKLDGNPIDYFKDWKGTVENLNNDEAHTLKFEWKPLAQELKDAGYSYNERATAISPALPRPPLMPSGPPPPNIAIPFLRAQPPRSIPLPCI